MPEDPNLPKPGPKGPRDDIRRSRNLVLLAVIGLGLVTLWLLGQGIANREPLTANAFEQALLADEVEKIKIINNELRAEVTFVKTEDVGTSGRAAPRMRELFLVDSDDARALKNRATALAAEREARGEAARPVVTTEPASALFGYLGTILLWIILIGILWFFLIRQMRGVGQAGGLLSFGRSRAQLAAADQITITFEDVAGIDDAKAEVTEIIEFLKNPDKFRRLGGRIPRGVLLVGQPGCGKTLLAKAIAGEAGVPFFSICGSDFVEMFVGVGASRVRDLFKQAKERSPCIIFLDEIDAVGRKRGTGMGGGHDEREQTLNAILVEMDGFDTDEGVIVLASTNRPDVLDPALLRPGRFDRQVVIDMPDLVGREAVLRVHARKAKVSKDVDFVHLARGTTTFSGAELEALINEAAILAAMRTKDAVDMDDLEEARDKVKWGRQKRSRKLEEQDRLVTAYHEAGHALVAALLEDTEPVHKVTIVPRGPSLGATMQLPERDQYHFQKRRMMSTLAVLFGGRIAELMFCGDISAGAASDIEQASSLARRMVCEWGMSSELGPVDYAMGPDPILGGEARRRPLSEQTALLIDKEVRALIDQGYKTAEKLITKNRDKIEAITQALMRYETLSGKDIDNILAGEEPEAALQRAKLAEAAAKTEPAAPAKATADPAIEATPPAPVIQPGLA